jgi:hypothetical protein
MFILFDSLPNCPHARFSLPLNHKPQRSFLLIGLLDLSVLFILITKVHTGLPIHSSSRPDTDTRRSTLDTWLLINILLQSMNSAPRSDSPEFLPSSGSQTPDLGTQSGSNSTTNQPTEEGLVGSATGYLSSMWGMIRRFSSEDTQFASQVEAFFGGDTQQQPTDGINGVYHPVKRTLSPFRPPPLDPLVLHGYKDDTPGTARLLSHAVAEEIRTMVPERLRITEDWRLIYSLEQDGSSLSTLYQKCRQFHGARVGFVLVVRDQEGAVCLRKTRREDRSERN